MGIIASVCGLPNSSS